jgi:SAM-dependent methyltransferase
MGILNPVQLPDHLSRKSEADPAFINGDHDLSSDDRQAYLKFHATRNRANTRKSHNLHIKTRPVPVKIPMDPSLASPSRLIMDAFVRDCAAQYTRYWGGRKLRVLDIGCGSGYGSTLLEQGGMQGEYIGIDHEAHPAFDQITSAKFARRQIITDILELKPETIAPVDLLISMTSLEHFEDDAAALAIARETLGPDSGELHLIPAEDGLRLWETHGWRQYSPACVRDLCPEADIFRIGGAASGFVHTRCITNPNRNGIDWRAQHPRLYRSLRTLGYLLDPLSGCKPAALYAAVRFPGGASI